MLARLLRLLLLFELFGYFLASLWLIGLAAWRPFAALLLMCLLAAAWRTWMIVVTYGFASLHRSPPPAQFRIGIKRQLFEGAREVAALTALLGAESFGNVFPKPDAPCQPGAGQLPLLLIHGYNCNRGFWWWLKPRLEAQGRSVASLTLEPMHGDIDAYAEQIAQRVNWLCRITGAARVVLVGHSMGGLVARAYLRRYGEERVARLITLGTPHQGSVLAQLGMGRNARQMEQGNAWLRELATAPLPIPCVAVFSWQDNYVMPQRNAMLAGAENLALAGVGHLAMSISPAVLNTLLKLSAV
ncbi:MAG: alpha/beta fold hydrolase [Proteobacteria bacterium]|nr:alpha/beta fold hydrolase [Pseudomonadota bacterium]